MNGAQSLLQTLVNGGVEVCFTNPGTSEMHFIAALDRVHGMRAVLGLFEGVCTGAADGYARMAGKPAATLLHLGPGLGNGFANLHNARRANTPLVNIVGDHATYHLRHDPPLATDIESIVGGFSGWVRRSRSAADVPADAADAITAAMTPPGRVATLILPADCSWDESREPAPAPATPRPTPVEPEQDPRDRRSPPTPRADRDLSLRCPVHGGRASPGRADCSRNGRPDHGKPGEQSHSARGRESRHRAASVPD